MISSWIARHIAVRRVISGIALVTFSTCFIFADAWAAVKVKVPERYAPIGFDNNARLLEPVKKFSPSTFILPPYLGHIGDFRVTPSERTTIQDPRSTIIHIQDAHCDYAAQHKIADIIDYLRGEYGINTVNLEGGKGDYDLSVFTDIKDKRVREKVVDSFVKEGLVNGAEFFAVNNPGRIKLWGVEDTGLYLKNLKVYRKSLGSKKEIGTYLRSIDRILIDLKRHMFSKELLELDEKYTRYKTETIDLKEYLTFLIQKWGLSPARFPGTSASGLSPFLDFPNVYSLYQSLEQEENIDFKKAEHEREELIDRLQKILSNVELEELVLKTVKFGQEMISAADFYAYLLKKAKAINLDLEAFPELQKYILYISTYNAADKLKVMMETNDLENRIREALYENDGQRRLDLLSRNLTLMRNLFDVKLTRQRFEYYKKNRDSFAVKDYISFIDEEAPVYDIVAELDEDVHKLDEYREQMAGFYEYSFKRDEVFLENIKFSDEARGSKFEPQDRRTTILVTGGFHTENLRGLCEKNNVSYVSIIPNFENEAGYENPYFRLLANGPDFIPESPQTSNAGFSLAVAALLTELGIDVYGPRAKVLLPEIVKRLRESPDKDISDISAELGLKAPGFSINSARDTAGENSGQTPPRSMEPVKILGAVLAGAALIGLNILLFALANIAPAWYIFSVPMIASLVGFGFGYEAYRHIKARIHPSNLNKKGERLKNWHKEQQDIITELRKDLNISGDIRILPKQDLPVFTTWWDALKELISPHAPPIIDSDTAAKTIHVTPGMLYDYPYLKQAVLHELSELKTPSETKATRAERKAGIRALPRLAFNLPWAWVRNMPKKKLFVMIMALISACASTTSYFVYKKVEESRILGRVVELKKIDPKEAISELINLLNDEDAYIRAKATQALEIIEAKEAVPQLIKLLEDKDSDVRVSATFALELIVSEEAIPALVVRLKDEHPEVRKRAIWALLRFRETRYQDSSFYRKYNDVICRPIIDMLKDKDSDVRAAAAYALGLGGFDRKEIILEFIELLDDKDSDVRAAAVEGLALSRILGDIDYLNDLLPKRIDVIGGRAQDLIDRIVLDLRNRHIDEGLTTNEIKQIIQKANPTKEVLYMTIMSPESFGDLFEIVLDEFIKRAKQTDKDLLEFVLEIDPSEIPEFFYNVCNFGGIPKVVADYPETFSKLSDYIFGSRKTILENSHFIVRMFDLILSSPEKFSFEKSLFNFYEKIPSADSRKILLQGIFELNYSLFSSSYQERLVVLIPAKVRKLIKETKFSFMNVPYKDLLDKQGGFKIKCYFYDGSYNLFINQMCSKGYKLTRESASNRSCILENKDKTTQIIVLLNPNGKEGFEEEYLNMSVKTVIHRGHSYQTDDSLTGEYDKEAVLVLPLGCRGLGEIGWIHSLYPQSTHIATKSTGTGVKNNELTYYLLEAFVQRVSTWKGIQGFLNKSCKRLIPTAYCSFPDDPEIIAPHLLEALEKFEDLSLDLQDTPVETQAQGTMPGLSFIGLGGLLQLIKRGKSKEQRRGSVGLLESIEPGRLTSTVKTRTGLKKLFSINFPAMPGFCDKDTVAFPIENHPIISNLKTIRSIWTTGYTFGKNQGVRLAEIMFNLKKYFSLDTFRQFQERSSCLAGKIIADHLRPAFFLIFPPETLPDLRDTSREARNSGLDASISSSIPSMVSLSKIRASVWPLASTKRTMPVNEKGNFVAWDGFNKTTFSSDNPFSNDVDIPLPPRLAQFNNIFASFHPDNGKYNMSFSKLSSAFQESGGIRGMEPQPMEPVKLLSAALAGAGLGGLLQLVKNKKKVELDKLAKLVDSIEQGGVTYTDRLTTSLEELMLPPTLPGEMLIKETEEEGKVSILEALTEGYAFLKDLLNAQTLEGVQSILKDQSFLADILLEESRDGFMAILGALIENDEVELNQENIVGQLFPDMNKEIEERKALIKRLLDESTREEVQEQLYDQFLKMAKNGSMANNGYITLLFERPFGIDELLEMNELEIRNLFAENRTEKTIEDLLTLKEAALFCPIEKIREYKSKDDQKSKDNVRSHGLPFSISENDGAYVNGVSQNIYPPSLPAEWKSGLKKEVLPQPLYSPPLEGNSHIDVQNRRKRTPTTSVLIPEDIDLNSSVVNNPRATIIQFSILDAMNSLLASVKNFFILKTIIPLRNSSVKVIQIPQIGKHMHSFRFPAYIWQEFQPLLRALGENIYDTVKTHGLAWTDGDGTLHRIDDLLGGEDSDKTNAVWQAAMEAVNAANKYNASEEITDSSKVKNVIAYHEKLHALFRDRKYKELIARFRQKLEGEEIFGGPLTETHPFITAFRKIYGSPHAAESLHATDTIDWYLEEFLTLSMQEWKLFDKKYAVLDKMMDVADETESSVLNGHEQSVKNGLNNVFEELKKVDQEIISSINRLLEEGKELRETFIEVMSRYNKVRIWKIKIAPSMFIGAGVMMMLPVIMLFSLPGLVAALPIAPWAAGAIAAALVETGIVKIIWVKLRLEKINKLAGFAHALIKGGEYHQALYANEALARRVDEVVRKAGRLESLDDAAVIRSYSGHLESVIKRLSRVVLARELKNYDKKHTADEYETLARGEKVVDGVVTGILKEYNRRTIPDIGEVTVVFKNSEVNSDDWKYLIRAGGIIIVGSNNITEKIAKEHNIPCVKITEEAEREIRSKNRDIPEILLRAGDNGACVLAEKAGYTDKNDMISKQIASKGISISEHFGYYDTELEHLSDVLEILPEGHLRGLKKIRKYWWGDLAGKIFPFQRKSIFVSNNRELGKTSIILHENVHRWLPGLGIAKRIRLLYAVSFKKGSKLRKLIFSKLIVYFSVLAPIVAFLNVYFPLVADIMIVILIMAETRKIVMSKARLPREYQQDFVTAYSWRGMWVDEEFAELYAAYALQGDVFRRLAGYNEKLREKYDILKNNVFYGKEYTRDGLGNISLLKTDKESTGTIPVTGGKEDMTDFPAITPVALIKTLQERRENGDYGLPAGIGEFIENLSDISPEMFRGLMGEFGFRFWKSTSAESKRDITRLIRCLSEKVKDLVRDKAGVVSENSESWEIHPSFYDLRGKLSRSNLILEELFLRTGKFFSWQNILNVKVDPYGGLADYKDVGLVTVNVEKVEKPYRFVIKMPNSEYLSEAAENARKREMPGEPLIIDELCALYFMNYLAPDEVVAPGAFSLQNGNLMWAEELVEGETLENCGRLSRAPLIRFMARVYRKTGYWSVDYAPKNVIVCSIEDREIKKMIDLMPITDNPKCLITEAHYYYPEYAYIVKIFEEEGFTSREIQAMLMESIATNRAYLADEIELRGREIDEYTVKTYERELGDLRDVLGEVESKLGLSPPNDKAQTAAVLAHKDGRIEIKRAAGMYESAKELVPAIVDMLRKAPTYAIEPAASLEDVSPVMSYLRETEQTTKKKGHHIRARSYLTTDEQDEKHGIKKSMKAELDKILPLFHKDVTHFEGKDYDENKTRMVIRLISKDGKPCGEEKERIRKFIRAELIKLSGGRDDRALMADFVIEHKLRFVEAYAALPVHLNTVIDLGTDITMVECDRYGKSDGYPDEPAPPKHLGERFLSLLSLSITNYDALITEARKRGGKADITTILAMLFSGWLLNIKAVDWESIREWKDAQDEVLRAL